MSAIRSTHEGNSYLSPLLAKALMSDYLQRGERSQDGPAQVVYAGTFWGTTVITTHTVRAGGLTQRYLVALGKLGTARPVSAGETAAPGTQLGTAGPSARCSAISSRCNAVAFPRQ